MSDRKSVFGGSVAALLASAGLVAADHGVQPAAGAPTPTPTPAPAPAASEAPADASAETVAAIQHANAMGIEAGTKQANERVAAVFASTEAQANPKLAAFLLTETTASAEKIVDQLKAQGPAAAPAAAAPAPAPTPAPAPAKQPTVASMQQDGQQPAAARDPGHDGGASEGAVSLEAAFPGLDFSGKSPIVEDGVSPAFSR